MIEGVCASHQKLGYRINKKLYTELVSSFLELVYLLPDSKIAKMYKSIVYLTEGEIKLSLLEIDTPDSGTIFILPEQYFFPTLEQQLISDIRVRSLLHSEGYELNACGTGYYYIDYDSFEPNSQVFKSYDKNRDFYRTEKLNLPLSAGAAYFDEEDSIYHIKKHWFSSFVPEKLPESALAVYLKYPVKNIVALGTYKDETLKAVSLFEIAGTEVHWLMTSQDRTLESVDHALGNVSLMNSIFHFKRLGYKTFNLGIDTESHKLRFNPKHRFVVGIKKA